MADVTNHDDRDEGNEHRQHLLVEFSTRLKTARESTWPKPKQKDWARLMGLSDVRQYQRWEHGEQLPPLERLPLISKVSGVDFSDLFGPPGGLTRDGIQDHFDARIEELEKKVEANFYALAETMVELRKLIEARLPE